MKRRDIITLAILAIIFGIIFLLMFITKGNEEDVKGNTEFNELTLLTDESIFLSVVKNINKICEYSNDDSQVLDFIMKNDIDFNNYKNTSFKAEQIYVVSKLNLYKYYIKGNLYEDIIDEKAKFLRQEYFILNYDMENSSFNIELIDENRYESASEEDYIFETINKNDYNMFEYSSLSQKSRAVMYFNDFINKMYSSPNEAYNLLSTSTKLKYFSTYEHFKNFILKHNNISLVEYSVNGSEIGIKDNYNIEYIFDIAYILKYNVTINMTEE